jgi:anti-sigma factor RsiW
MASILDCGKVQPELSEFVDGVLSEKRAWEIEMHLASCAVCSRVADDFRATSRLLSALPAAELSAGFEARLALRLADQALAPRPLTLWGRLRRAWDERSRRVQAAYASGFALACAVPVCVAFVVRASGSGVVAPTQLAEASPLEAIVRSHASAASAEPLGDPSGLMLASADAEAGRP